MKKWILPVIFIFFNLMAAHAQTKPSNDPFEIMQKEIERMMSQMRSGMAFDFGLGMDTMFYFKLDTTFGGDNRFLFRMNPPGAPGSDFDFFEKMDSLSRTWERSLFGSKEAFPADDGNTVPDDGLLPEERLRLEEEKESRIKSKSPMDPSKPVPADVKKSKIKTSRI